MKMGLIIYFVEQISDCHLARGGGLNDTAIKKMTFFAAFPYTVLC